MTFQWDNPPTTVYVEMKYGSDLSMKTAGDDGQHGFPSDQLIRNVRVGLMECGWFRHGNWFYFEPRDFIVILCCPTKGHRLVERYCDPERLKAAIPHSDRLTGLPRSPFIGELSYQDIVTVLRRQRCRFTRPERYLIDSLGDYLTYKARTISGGANGSQSQIPSSSVIGCSDPLWSMTSAILSLGYGVYELLKTWTGGPIDLMIQATMALLAEWL